MKKIYKYLALFPLVSIGLTSLASCNQNDNTLYLRVINSEDYIYLYEKPGDEEDLTDQFEHSELVAEYLKEHKEYSRVKVIYDTSDTNETLYSELQTGKSNYDLMNVSDYMAQKIVSEGLAVPLYRHNGADISVEPDYNMIPNYQDFASRDIKQRLDQIEAIRKVYNKETKHLDEIVYNLKDFAVGYMWGTLGIVFNAKYPGFNNISEDEVIEDMQSFDTLWNSKYKGTISIKNSMRDTYALGVMHTYRDEFKQIKDSYFESDYEKYMELFSEYFNRCEQKYVNEVEKSLNELKENIFGLEVDSGKQDIITQKIGVNLAWSGDAVYSIEQSEDKNQVANPDALNLCYAVPEYGSNLWFDTWIMPKCNRSDAQYEVAHLFLDFLNDPYNASQNMSYTGYTSFVAGNEILELVRDWYDVRTDEIYEEVESKVKGKYVYDYYQVYSVNSNVPNEEDEEYEEFTALDYTDFITESEVNPVHHDSDRDNDLLYYFIPYKDSEGEMVEEPSSLDELYAHSKPVYLLDDEDEYVLDENDEKVQKKYGDLTIVDDPENELEVVDLTYFFKNTLVPFEVEEGVYDQYVEGVDTLFYSDCYLPYENEDGTQNISVGRSFFCQYPNEETIKRCAVMADYGKNNQYVMKMWEKFKSDPLPVWAIVVFAVIIAGILGFVAYLIINHVLKNKTKKARIAK